MVVRRAVVLPTIVSIKRSDYSIVMYFAAVNDDGLEESDDDKSSSPVDAYHSHYT